METKNYMNVKDAAAFLACPVSRIYSLTFKKVLPYYKFGATCLFKKEELAAYVESRKINPAKN